MSEGDVWAVHEPPATADVADSPTAPDIVLERPRDPDYPKWLIAGLFFLLAGVLQAATLFVDAIELGGFEPGYDSVDLDIVFGIRAAVMVACGVLLMVRRAREVAGGLAVGFGLDLLFGYSWQLRPSKLKVQFAGHGSLLLVGAMAMVAIGTVTVLVLIWRRREHVAERRTRAERRADRVVAVALGFAGAVLWWIAAAMSWFRISMNPILGGQAPVTRECCSWSQDDGWKQVGILAGGVAIVVLALFAATVRSRYRGMGLFLGLAAAGLQDLALGIAIVTAPMPSLYGIHYRDVFHGIGAVGNTTPGLWLGLIGLLLLSAGAVTRMALGSRKAAYPQNELERIMLSKPQL